MWYLKMGRYISAVEVPLRSERTQTHTRLASLEHQCQENEFPQYLSMNISWDSVWVRQRATGDPCKPKHAFTYLQTLSLSSRVKTAMQKVPRTLEKKINCLASGQGLEGQLSLDKSPIVPLLSPPYTQPTGAGRCQV